MPDERPDRPPISSSRLSATDIARHTFATVRRGFEPNEVRAYLELVARELQQWEQRDEQLREQVAAAEEAARHPVLDEATLTAALGQQSALVLRNAHDEAARIMGRAEADAQSLLHDAQEQARDLRVDAESTAAGRIAEAELAAGTVEQEARARAEEVVSEAQAEADAQQAQIRAEGEELLERARAQGRNVLMKVQEARREVLADLAQRRRALHLQIEQFRAARDELAATVLGVRDSVDTIVTDLAQAEDRARAAASAATTGEEAAVEVDDELDAEALVGVAEGGEAPPADEQPAPPADTATAEGEEADAGSSVDELFARIRASQKPEPDDAGPATEDDVEDEVEDEDEADAAGASPLVARRAAALDPIVATLSRRLKRSLQDDQNRLLDRLRSDAKGTSAAELPLPGERQRQAYVEAATPQLEAAFAAGLAFAREVAPSAAPATTDTAPVSAMADELAAEVVATLRRRLGSGEDAGEDPIERVRAAYREWRGERIERLVGDVALGAFSQGVLTGTGEGVSVRWLLAGGDGGCADCDDNSLADPVRPGSEFPTGHRHPPVHAGCRCLVTPVGP
jgi:DivIVA domain-containing protein